MAMAVTRAADRVQLVALTRDAAQAQDPRDHARFRFVS